MLKTTNPEVMITEEGCTARRLSSGSPPTPACQRSLTVCIPVPRRWRGDPSGGRGGRDLGGPGPAGTGCAVRGPGHGSGPEQRGLPRLGPSHHAWVCAPLARGELPLTHCGRFRIKASANATVREVIRHTGLHAMYAHLWQIIIIIMKLYIMINVST